jgi:hypothetical protein
MERGETVAQVMTERMENSDVINEIMDIVENCYTWNYEIGGYCSFNGNMFGDKIKDYFIGKAVDKII